MDEVVLFDLLMDSQIVVYAILLDAINECLCDCRTWMDSEIVALMAQIPP